jgi:subtilisin family serine protease
MGISTTRAYALLRQLGRQPSALPVVVAVLDGGLDTAHVDLRQVLWHNPGEVAGNGQDDDHDGYADDVYGWNFLGGPGGYNVYHNQKEETRLVAQLGPRYAGKQQADVPAAQRADFRLYQQAQREYSTQRHEAELDLANFQYLRTRTLADISQLKQGLGVTQLDSALLRRPPTTDTTLRRLATRLHRELRGNVPTADSLPPLFQRFATHYQDRLAYAYNLTYNPQALVGDQPANVHEWRYGNHNVQTELHYSGTEHGTHCAGLIGANRTNSLGVQGVADHVRLLSVRCIPDGDERDKDVANAIRYAVDHGAQIISMSFGKYFSPEKAVVDAAMRYADQHGVLLVHAAGNDHRNLDSLRRYPSGRFLNGKRIPNLLTVGASAATNDEHLPAAFSNYGHDWVDVFAPGVQVLSTFPGNEYRLLSGTSMATPVVAGMAAVLKTYFPQLTPADLKRLLLASAAPCHTPVRKPGTQELVDFATLSRTGGVVNLYEAVRLASSESATTATRP